jgi:hypothetical protein
MRPATAESDSESHVWVSHPDATGIIDPGYNAGFEL